MPTDREALDAALAQGSLILGRLDGPGLRKAYVETETAARKTLAQLPETCGTCMGEGFAHRNLPGAQLHYGTCPTCHGSGKVYPAELVERLERVIAFADDMSPEQIAVAVLDALGETP